MKEQEKGIREEFDSILQRLHRSELYGSIDALFDFSAWLMTETGNKLSYEQISYLHEHLMKMICQYKEGLHQ